MATVRFWSGVEFQTKVENGVIVKLTKMPEPICRNRLTSPTRLTSRRHVRLRLLLKTVLP
jgi:hypothetical protein